MRSRQYDSFECGYSFQNYRNRLNNEANHGANQGHLQAAFLGSKLDKLVKKNHVIFTVMWPKFLKPILKQRLSTIFIFVIFWAAKNDVCVSWKSEEISQMALLGKSVTGRNESILGARLWAQIYSTNQNKEFYLLFTSVDDIASTMQATWQSHMIRTHMIGWKESGGGHMENTKKLKTDVNNEQGEKSTTKSQTK